MTGTYTYAQSNQRIPKLKNGINVNESFVMRNRLKPMLLTTFWYSKVFHFKYKIFILMIGTILIYHAQSRWYEIK